MKKIKKSFGLDSSVYNIFFEPKKNKPPLDPKLPRYLDLFEKNYFKAVQLYFVHHYFVKKYVEMLGGKKTPPRGHQVFLWEMFRTALLDSLSLCFRRMVTGYASLPEAIKIIDTDFINQLRKNELIEGLKNALIPLKDYLDQSLAHQDNYDHLAAEVDFLRSIIPSDTNGSRFLFIDDAFSKISKVYFEVCGAVYKKFPVLPDYKDPDDDFKKEVIETSKRILGL